MGANAGKCAANKCCAGDEEINATQLMQQATMEETPEDEKGSERDAMKKKMDAIVKKGNLTFKMDTDELTMGGDKTVSELAELLKPFPEMSVKIAVFSAEMTGKWSDENANKKLCLMRARTVRKALQASGCENKMSAEGMGMADQQGTRCEFGIGDPTEIAILERKAMEWEQAEDKRQAEAAAAAAKEAMEQEEKQRESKKQAEAPVPEKPVSTAAKEDANANNSVKLEVVFVTGTGEQPVKFTKKPLGLSFKNKTPIVVNTVDGYAKEQGVQRGWQVKSINGVGLRDKGFPEVLQFLREQSLTLPDPETAAAKLPPLKDFEVLFGTRGSGQKLLTISKKPLGLAYKNSMPLVVTRAEGHAIECGIEAGWTILAVNGESLEGKQHYEATWAMQVCLNRLKNPN